MELYVWNFTKLWMKQICGRFSRGLSRDYVGLPEKVNNLKVCQLQSLVHRQLGIYIWLGRATFWKIQSGSKLVWIVIGISKTIWTTRQHRVFQYFRQQAEREYQLHLFCLRTLILKMDHAILKTEINVNLKYFFPLRPKFFHLSISEWEI